MKRVAQVCSALQNVRQVHAIHQDDISAFTVELSDYLLAEPWNGHKQPSCALEFAIHLVLEAANLLLGGLILSPFCLVQLVEVVEGKMPVNLLSVCAIRFSVINLEKSEEFL